MTYDEFPILSDAKPEVLKRLIRASVVRYLVRRVQSWEVGGPSPLYKAEMRCMEPMMRGLDELIDFWKKKHGVLSYTATWNRVYRTGKSWFQVDIRYIKSGQSISGQLGVYVHLRYLLSLQRYPQKWMVVLV